MHKLYSLILRGALFFISLGFSQLISAQSTTIATTFANNNGNAEVTFNFQNTNAYPVKITDIASVTGTSGSVAVQAWYFPSAINSSTAPPAVTIANGWTQFGSGTITGIANTTTTTPQTFLSNLNFVVPAGATYGICVGATGLRYSSTTAGTYTIPGGGCNIITGTNMGWAGGAIPAVFANNDRGFIGSVTFESVGPCTSPPVPGSVVSTQNPVCSSSNFTLSLVNSTGGTGQTYQWQSSPNNINWTNISGAANASLTTSATTSAYYRAAVSCGGTTSFSSSLQEVVNPLFRSGNYTINSSQPTGSTNFQTFTDAVNAIKCGIEGPVVFNVTTNVYNEQVIIPAIGGTSSTNTITFKGNQAGLSFNSTTTGARAGITLDGADYVTIDSLLITATGSATTEYGWGVQLTNGADNNRITNCTINVSTTNSTAYNFLGIVLGGNATTPISASNAGSNNIITGNRIIGGYYPVIAYGNSATPYPTGNVISNNIIQDAYSYSIYLYGNLNTVVSKNNISRPVRATSTTTAGVYISTGCSGLLIEKNRIHNMFDALTTNTSTIYGVYISATGTAATPNKIVNNAVYDINHNGAIYGIYNSGSAYMQAYHNTISLDNTSATAGATYGMYQVTAATGIDYRNNIVTITRGGSGAKYAMYFSTSGSTHTSNNNVLYNNSGGSGTRGIGYYGGTAYATLTDWQTANGGVYDQQSVSLDPVYLNAGSGDFTPTTSFVNNIGTPVGVTSDIMDKIRSTTNPDPGAYEFSTLTAGINMGAEGLVSPVVNSNGCYTAAETVTVRIRNNSTAAVNFATNPVTVTTTVTGATTQTLTATVNTGTLASDATKDVSMNQPLNMTVAGTYTINAATSIAGDVNTSNDAMLPVNRTKVALTSGSVSVSPSTYCAPTPFNPTLSSTGYAGTSGVQWLQSTAATTGFMPVSGATFIPYTVSAISQPMYYRLVGTCGTARDTSAVVMVSYSNPQITGTTPASICGAGSVTLQATGSTGTSLNWYGSATGGLPLATGNSFTTSISANTTFYVEANEGGVSTGASPILITELDLGTNDRLEIQNISGNPIDVTGWKVAISDSYTDITSVNANIQALSGIMAPGEINSWTDATAGPNYWGSNILYNPGAYPTFTGWAAIIDNNNNLVDIVFMNWPAANIQAASLTIGTATISPGSKWTGNGVDITNVAATQSVSRQGNSDNNSLSDFSIINLSIGTTNPGMNLPFSGFGCASARTAVIAKIDGCPTPVTLLNFKGERGGPVNKLVWTTVTENNNRGFELQRSADGNNFAGLAFIASKAVNGNSTAAITYTYDDAKPLTGNGYYRLKQTDNDGKFTYSQVVLIKGLKVTSLIVSSMYPNPVKDWLNMIITSPVAEKIKVVVTDVSGRVRYRQTEMITVGDNPVRLPVSTWAKGTYFIKAVCTNGYETAVQKFIKE